MILFFTHNTYQVFVSTGVPSPMNLFSWSPFPERCLVAGRRELGQRCLRLVIEVSRKRIRVAHAREFAESSDCEASFVALICVVGVFVAFVRVS